MKVYALLFYGPDMEWYFFATLSETKAFARRRVQELIEEGIPRQNISFDFDPWEAANTREGVCGLLNQLVTAACLNEG